MRVDLLVAKSSAAIDLFWYNAIPITSDIFLMRANIVKCKEMVFAFTSTIY